MSANNPKTGYVCAQCGNCCCWPGSVRINAAEINIIACFLKISPDEFTDRYTRLIDNRSALSLTEKKDGSCILLSGNRCLIHDVKPRQCREFPDKWRFSGFEELCNAKQISAKS